MDLKKKIPCSVPLLTLNSEKYLERCLESLRDFDDVFIVDGNSTDTTLEIARRWGIPIYKQVDTDEPNVRISNFAAMRNKAAAYCRNNWILSLDSDEYLSPELVGEIRNALEEHGEEEKTAFTLANYIVIDNKIIKHSFTNYRYIRLYNKQSGIVWNESKSVHETFFLPEGIHTYDLQERFYAFSPSYHECLKKDEHYLSLAKKKMEESISGSRNLDSFGIFRSILKNFFRAGKFFFESIYIYIRYGFKNSIPPLHAWRNIRYSLIISYFRTVQFFRSLLK